MGVRNLGRLIVVGVFFSLFVTCGDLDAMFPTTGSYQVKTLINGVSLDECSIIRSDDTIRPYFAVSVVNDPDLIGLLVYIQDSQGKIIGERVQYTLQAYAAETPPTETEKQEEEEPEEPAEKDDADSEEEWTDWVLTQQTTKEKWGFTDVKNKEKNNDVEIAVKSLAEDLPYFSLPKNMEIGSYILVFEAIGKRETLSRTETAVFYLGSAEFNLKDISMYLSGLSDSQLISPGTTVMLEARLDYDSRLDPYVVWYNGKNIISEGKIRNGAGSILWKAPEQVGFYSLRLEAFPYQLKRNNFSGIIRGINLPVSTKATSLGYFFENNPENTARNPLAIGTAYPEYIRLMTTETAEDPENPESTEIEKENILIPPPLPELAQWYQFECNLRDSMSKTVDEQALLPIGVSPRWAAAGQIYGLSTGKDEPYLLPPIQFLREKEDQGGGIFLFHIKSPAEGTIFTAFFPQASSVDGILMEMLRTRNGITLRLSAGNAAVEMPVYLTAYELQGLIPIVVEFYIRPYRMEAKISLGDLQSKAGEIRLPGALSGEGRIRLGGTGKAGLDKPAVINPVIQAKNASATTATTSISTSTPASTILTPTLPTILTSTTPTTASLPTTTASTASTPATTQQSSTPALTTSAQSTPLLTSASTSTTSLATIDDTDIPVFFAEEFNEDIPAETDPFEFNTIWNEFAVLLSAVPLLQEEIAASVHAGEDADRKAEVTTEEKTVPAVQNDKQSAENKEEAVKPPVALAVLYEEVITETDEKETEEAEEAPAPVEDVVTDDDSDQERETLAALPENT